MMLMVDGMQILISEGENKHNADRKAKKYIFMRHQWLILCILGVILETIRSERVNFSSF